MRSGALATRALARVSADRLASLRGEVADVMARYPACIKRKESDGPPFRMHSLYNPAGRTDDPADDDHRDLRPKVFLVPECPELARLVAYFGPELQLALITCAPPGAHLREHRENVFFPPDPRVPRALYGGQLARLRLHLPITASERAYSTIGGRRYRFEEGVLYLYNNTLLHSVTQRGETDRAHLLFDVWLSDRLFVELFAPQGAAVPSPFLPLTDAERADIAARNERLADVA